MLSSMSMLYVVGTPIGNLEDITLRALSVLKEVDVILCEDTRVTRRLLERHRITGKKLVAYNEKQSGSSERKIIGLLEEGSGLALVSDAGTPTVSDPGARLVRAVRDAGFSVVPIPGANAAVAALSASGLPSSDFLFLGFLPHKKGRETLFNEIAESRRTVVFYESPHRLMKTLESLTEHLGAEPEGARRVVVARELTKIHEEFVEGSVADVLDHFKQVPDTVRGEFIVLVEKKVIDRI